MPLGGQGQSTNQRGRGRARPGGAGGEDGDSSQGRARIESSPLCAPRSSTSEASCLGPAVWERTARTGSHGSRSHCVSAETFSAQGGLGLKAPVSDTHPMARLQLNTPGDADSLRPCRGAQRAPTRPAALGRCRPGPICLPAQVPPCRAQKPSPPTTFSFLLLPPRSHSLDQMDQERFEEGSWPLQGRHRRWGC